MRKQKHNVCFGTVAWLLVVVFFVCSTSVSTAFVHVVAMQYTLYSSDAFYRDGGDGKFFLGEDHTWDTDVVGNILIEGDDEYNYEIRKGSITLTDSRLLHDMSGDPNFGLDPGQAAGLFEKGATLIITGDLTTVGGQEILASGILMQSTITSDFHAVEEEWIPDFLDAQMQCDLTGGEFFTGAQSGFVLGRSFITDITLRWCTQSYHSELEDFSTDIGYAMPSIVQINSNEDYPVPAPEPASLLLFGLAGLLIKKSKSNN
jgi:hypothetical protein